ncbi:MAG: hypothetical protein ACT4PT_09060 [Methanobacteriota archaeon]
MPHGNIVHVVGTGTIGEPLVSLFSHFRRELGIDEVTFYKHSPRVEDRPMVQALGKDGAKLAVAKASKSEFEALGLPPAYEAEEAMRRATVIVDATPEDAGLANKEKWYNGLANVKGFLAQGSEAGFGKPYAWGVNDRAVRKEDRFLHVVSCNTHNIAVLVKLLGLSSNGASRIESGRFVCIRRASDVGDGKLSASPEVSRHKEKAGTHHATDVIDLYKTLDLDLPLYSSAIKIPTQYMHAVWFDLVVKDPITRDEVLSRFAKETRVAVTQKNNTGAVFATGRERGFYGRILSQTVLCAPSVAVRGDREVVGFCFTPQDGNVLLTNAAAVARFLHPEDWEKRMTTFDRFLPREV